MTRQLPRYRRHQHWVDGRRVVEVIDRHAPAMPAVSIKPQRVYRSYRITRRFDGMMTSDPEGRLHRVFVPAWWQVWRWFSWWRASVRSELQVIANGRFYAVRAVGVSNPISRVRRA